MSNRAPRPTVAPSRDVVETFNLSTPIKAWGKEITLLEFRDPTLGDFEELDGLGDVGKVRRLIELLAGLPLNAAKAISGRDFADLGEVMGGFLGRSLGDGD